MNTSGSSGSIPFRSKKKLMDSPCSKSEIKNPTSAAMDLPTPEKPPENMFSRSRNRGIALSVKEIRQAANYRRRSENSTAKNKLVFSPSDSASSPSKLKSTGKNEEKEELAEKYEILADFFDGLDNAIRLSKLKRSAPTFSNISTKIENLTERRFLYSHLAQLKHILPEAIEIRRILTFDEKTRCMKPDLQVNLIADSIDISHTSKSESKNINLRKVFRTRLADFVEAHPQGDEVPEELLPEPFNRRQQINDSNDVVSSSSIDELSVSIEDQNREVASWLSPPRPKKTYTLSSNTKQGSSQSDSSIEETTSTPSKQTSSRVQIDSTPVKIVTTPARSDHTSVVSTPPELASTPARMFSSSLPAHSQKRSRTRLDNNSDEPPNKLLRRPSALRPLNFDSFVEKKEEQEVEEVSDEGTSSDDDDDFLSILSKSLLQSIKKQEKKAIEEQDPAISLAKRRCKMITRLPKFFNVTHFLIQSIGRSVITKDELVYKIIAVHSDISDRKEVEEQLKLLLELVPEWISEKKSFSGDLLVCINKMASPEAIRARLEEESRRASMPQAS